MPRQYIRGSDEERFWPKVDRNGPTPTHRPDLGSCWCWTASRSHNGYGRVRFNGQSRRAHVVAYILTTGHEPPAETPFITHLCDNPICVRPTHLQADTAAGNSDQMVERGRSFSGEPRRVLMRQRAARGDRNGSRTHPERLPRGDAHHSRMNPETVLRGERQPNAILSDNDVRTIRLRYAAGSKQVALAAEYRVSKVTIHGIVHRKTWRHLDP